VVITKKGKPVAKLVPPDEPKRDVLGCMAGTATIIGDVKSSLLPPLEKWDAVRLRWAARFRTPPGKASRARSRRATR
jgi:antitoxin (DNA-binding transcriptional repressor) of toxin-antitoxin stability system